MKASIFVEVDDLRITGRKEERKKQKSDFRPVRIVDFT